MLRFCQRPTCAQRTSVDAFPQVAREWQFTVNLDPITAVTSITSQVLRRIADAIDGQPSPPATPPVHIDTVHVHIIGPAPTERGPRLFRRGREE